MFGSMPISSNIRTGGRITSPPFSSLSTGAGWRRSMRPL